MAKKTVSESALMSRINRKLAPEGERLRKARSWSIDTRNYYCVSTRSNTIESAHDDLEKLGRDVGVLRDDESLAVPSDPMPYADKIIVDPAPEGQLGRVRMTEAEREKQRASLYKAAERDGLSGARADRWVARGMATLEG